MGEGYLKYVVGALILVAIGFGALHLLSQHGIPFAGRGPAAPAVVESRPAPPPPVELVWSWRYRITTEEQLPEQGDLQTTEKVGPWVSMLVRDGEPAIGRIELPDGSYLQIKGKPRMLNGATGFEDFSYRWAGMQRSDWLPHHGRFFPAQQQDTVSGTQSSWGYALEAAIPEPAPRRSPPASSPDAAKQPNAAEPASSHPPAGTPPGKGADDAVPHPKGAVAPDPAPATTPRKPGQSAAASAAGRMHAIGSWSNATNGYKGTITLWLEMQLSDRPSALP